MPVPRTMAPQARRHSSRDGSSEVSLVATTWRGGPPMVSRISATPNRPITTGMKPTPS